MSRRLLRAALVLGIGLAAAQAALAEAPEPRALLGPELMLLSQPEVQTDLNLTRQQAKKIDALAAGFRADAGRAQGAKGKADSPDPTANLDEEVAAYNRELAVVLTGPQRQRVREIQIQMLGNVALLEPPIQKQVGLSPEETKQIDAAAQENVALVKDLRSKLAAGEVSPEEFQTRAIALGRELDRRIGEIVSRDTLEKLAKLGGRPFAGARR
jgi:hypothetical protein